MRTVDTKGLHAEVEGILISFHRLARKAEEHEEDDGEERLDDEIPDEIEAGERLQINDTAAEKVDSVPVELGFFPRNPGKERDVDQIVDKIVGLKRDRND